MKLYAPVPIDHLNIIQEKVFELFPKESLNEHSLFYPNLENKLLKITELVDALDIGCTKFICKMAFIIMQPKSSIPIHIDAGILPHSLNIPIKNGSNSFVNFYQSNSQLTECQHDNINYFVTDETTCTLIDKIEMSLPHIINVKHLHNVDNFNDDIRIVLLIRLNNEFDVSKFLS